MFQKRLLPLYIAVAVAGAIPVTSVAQSSTATTPVEKNDEPVPVLLEEVVVQGVRQAELNAREAERDKKAFSSIIAQDDAGNFADQNVAESLQRLPGITLQKSEGEGQTVSVRGLGPGFVTVSMNGSEMASAGGANDRDDRSFSLDGISADLLGGIIVNKSLLPSMDLNSIGANVDVKSVSAFDKKGDSLKFSAQTYYQDYSGDASPKVSLLGTNLLADDTVGLTYSLAWEKRYTHSYEVLHHEEQGPREVSRDLPNFRAVDGDPTMLIPFEFQNRQEVAERTKLGATFGIEFRPRDDSEYSLRAAYNSLEDLDLAWREYFRFGQAQESDIAFINPANRTFGVIDADLQQQMFIQDGEAETANIDFTGKNIIEADSGDLTFDYVFNFSKSQYDKPDGRRAQFRVRDVPMIGAYGREFLTGAVISPAAMAELAGIPRDQFPSNTDSRVSGYGNGLSATNFKYDNLFLEVSERLEDLFQFKIDVTKEFNDSLFTYVKTGAAVKSRDRERSRDRWSLVPATYSTNCSTTECTYLTSFGNLNNFAYDEVEQSSFVYPAITLNAAEEAIAITREIANNSNKQGAESAILDYAMTEDSFAAYIEAEIVWADIHSLIFGVRWDRTEFNSSGEFTIQNDNFELGSGGEVASLDYQIALKNAGTEYDNFFPSLHYRMDLDTVVVRSALWTSFSRPSFDQARAFADIDGNFSLCNPVTNLCSSDPSATVTDGVAPTAAALRSYTLAPNNVIDFGNPKLEPMTAVNLDTSISWYASDDLYFQVAFFYKDIENYLVEVLGDSNTIGSLPLNLPVDQVSEFIIPTDVPMLINWTINGRSAQVYGLELSYSQNFNSGMFVQANASITNSTAELDESQGGGKLEFPYQSDQTFNLSLGWENQDVSTRLIANYQSEYLERIGASRLLDIYRGDVFSLDFKATYQVNDDIKVYFDALNVTDEYTIHYFRGNESTQGNMLYHSELFGRSVQLGINYQFM